MVRHLLNVLILSAACALAGCASSSSSVKPTADAKLTPAERFAKDQKRRQQEAEERQRREEFMNRQNARRR